MSVLFVIFLICIFKNNYFQAFLVHFSDSPEWFADICMSVHCIPVSTYITEMQSIVLLCYGSINILDDMIHGLYI